MTCSVLMRENNDYAMMSTHLQTWRQCLRVPWIAADSLWVWQIRRSSLGLPRAQSKGVDAPSSFASLRLFDLLCSAVRCSSCLEVGAKQSAVVEIATKSMHARSFESATFDFERGTSGGRWQQSRAVAGGDGRCWGGRGAGRALETTHLNSLVAKQEAQPRDA